MKSLIKNINFICLVTLLFLASLGIVSYIISSGSSEKEHLLDSVKLKCLLDTYICKIHCTSHWYKYVRQALPL